MQLEDKQILELISDAETIDKGFNALVDKYQEPLYWHVRRMVQVHEDADDILQNTFIKVYKSIAKFRGDSKLYTWIYRIATNESITFINKRKHIDELNDNIRLQEDPFFDGDEIHQKLSVALNKLPPKQKQVFVLRYYDEMNYKDMSDILETSVGALKASYHHAVKKIENYLKQGIIHV